MERSFMNMLSGSSVTTKILKRGEGRQKWLSESGGEIECCGCTAGSEKKGP